MENLARIIAKHPFCKELERYHLDLLSSCASNVRVEKDFYLFREGGEAHHAVSQPLWLMGWERKAKAKKRTRRIPYGTRHPQHH
jgi:hypothetical protein